MRIKSKTSKITTAGILVGLGIILPFATSHGFGIAGTVLLPIHIPVLICGLLCGPWYGLLVGAILPLINCILTSMPPLYPMLPIMTGELAVYGLISGLLLHKTHLKSSKMGVYVSLVVAMILGRATYGLIYSVLLIFNPQLKALSVWGAIVTGIAGIVIQLILVPAIIYAVGGFTKRMDENAIISARNLISKGKATCVVIKDGKILTVEYGRGVKPIIDLYRQGVLEGAVVVDKIIGKAAAMVLSLAKVERVYGLTMSSSAIEWFKNQNIPYKAEEETEMIINRKGDGRCPMEEAVSEVNTAKEGLERIVKKIEELGRK